MKFGIATAVLMATVHAVGQGQAAEALKWHDHYGEAMRLAKQANQMLLVEFHADQTSLREDRLVEALAADAQLRQLADRYTLVRVALSEQYSVGGKKAPLIQNVAFAELQGQPGIALIDLRDPDSEHYCRVVSIYPFHLAGAYSKSHLQVLLDLPTGTLTQRTLIFAVRTAPERPASADGEFLDHLAEETESHSQYQAQLGSQGHHHWESRFHRINARLPGGLLSQEVCAESWPGQGLVEAAIECVRSWKHSAGHWRAVRSRHPFFGYDMKRGRNGVWYATGIFAGR
jgi:hypothetical protein